MFSHTLLCMLAALSVSSAADDRFETGDFSFPDGFKVIPINKTAGELHPDSVAPTSPADYYRLRSWLCLNGRQGMWNTISTKRFDFDPDQPDVDVDSETAARILAEHVVGTVTYCDSSAVVIVSESPDFYLLDWTWIEDGRWVNGGQGLASSGQDLINRIVTNLPRNLAAVPRIDRIHTLPADVEPFRACIANVRDTPEQFLLACLRGHPLVINGEYHRRKVSWDMLRRLIALPSFPETAGTIFMELPSWHQDTMDSFMESDTTDTEKILEIFRDEQPNGWWDKGEFEFLCDLRRLNRTLPADRRIKVVLADYQIPYSRITTTDDTREKEDRNTHMADIIEKHILTTADRRSHLFLVGCGHASKSKIPGIASTPRGMVPAMTAGAQLADRLGNDKVFTVMQHAISSDNSGRHRSKVRGGVFDRAFALNGNRPIGFALKGTPFGDEPYDGEYEMKYNPLAGTYADNFDGYLFLHPLDDEPQNPPLLEIFSPGFISEMKRRAGILGLENRDWMWFGTSADDMTVETVRQALLR